MKWGEYKALNQDINEQYQIRARLNELITGLLEEDRCEYKDWCASQDVVYAIPDQAKIDKILEILDDRLEKEIFK